MTFCPKCGAILSSKRQKDGTISIVCLTCGHTESIDKKNRHRFREKQKVSTQKKMETIIIENDDGQPRTAAMVNEQCPKCGKTPVYSWQMQTRSADEPPTTFFRCPACGHSWRFYG